MDSETNGPKAIFSEQLVDKTIPLRKYGRPRPHCYPKLQASKLWQIRIRPPTHTLHNASFTHCTAAFSTMLCS
jgi:hypothetical protein